MSTVLKILLFKRVSSRFLRVSFVPKFSPYVLSLSRLVPEILHARVREHISVIANDEKVESGDKDLSKVRGVYL